MMHWFLRRFPVVLFAVGLAVIAAALVRALADAHDPVRRTAALLIALYLGWVLLEARVTLRTSRGESSEADRGTEVFYGTARFATGLAAVWGPLPWESWSPLLLLPLLPLAAGIALRLAAIRALGRFYSHRVRTVDGHRVAQGGPYRLLRHPAYSGMLLAHAGFVAFFLNPLSVAAFLVLLVPALVRRILVEERALAEVPGYTEFARGRRRLIPAVW